MNETLKKLIEIVNESSEAIENYAQGNDEYVEAYERLMEDILDYGIVKKTRHYKESEPSLVGVEVVFYCGGPTVWADTEKREIIGTWGTDMYKLGLSSDAIALIEENALGLL